MNEYAIVANLEPDDREVWVLDDLPLHLTIVQPFLSDKPSSEIAKVITDVLKDISSFNLQTIARKRFGPSEGTMVEHTQDLRRIYDVLKSKLQPMKFKEPQYSGNEYIPHITDQNGRLVEVGKTIAVDNIFLVRVEDNKAYVEVSYGL